MTAQGKVVRVCKISITSYNKLIAAGFVVCFVG